ncbi:MAG: hypothetical protein J0M18_12370 [Ignavibacteria bacterium]|nr:hypothetical protein [Ignavibacteria bacterium]
MNKLFAFIFILTLPSLLFSQGVNKTNLGFMAGLSVPTASKDFRNSHSSGFNFNINVDHTVSESIVLGGELDFARQTGTITDIYPGYSSYTKDNNYQFISLDAFMKLQNNLAHVNEGQFFVKAGGGLWLAAIDKGTGHGGGPGPGYFGILFGPGFNYLPGNNMKITSALEYRLFIGKGEAENISLLQFKVGFSFCLNPR